MNVDMSLRFSAIKHNIPLTDRRSDHEQLLKTNKVGINRAKSL